VSETPLPLTFPLHGARLIEASAGTGKTYTLAALYVRLILRHGEDKAFQGPQDLMPPDILVVTFTEAATRELRDRIRDRLARAARCFRGMETPATHDAFLNALLADYPDDDQRQLCADRLDAAAQWMDEAAVYTIHGFCSRMLRQHAFDSGSLFDLELSQEEDLILERAVQDYWRTFCYQLSGEEAAMLGQVAQTPAQLQSRVRPLLDEALTPDDTALADKLGTLAQQHREQINALKQRWGQWAEELEALFQSAWAEKRLGRKKPQSKAVLGWFEKLRTWAADPDAVDPGLSNTFFDRLDPNDLAEQSDNIDELLRHEALPHRNELFKPQDSLPPIGPAILPHAAAWIRERIQRQKRSQGVIGFDDMLTRLRDALRGPNGDKLASIIREQFPVAMIDEFQDTDPVQYETFQRIYGEAAASTDSIGWFMIGDPKQAIYAFRGADIFTYLKAREAVGDNRHTLGRNFRSSAALVNAVNHVFQRADQQDEGVFLLQRAIPFEPVAPNGLKESFQVDGKPHPALSFWLLDSDKDNDTSITVGEYLPAMAEACATEMTHLLNQGADGKARFHDGDDGTLKPADMAVLVRNGREAQAIRDALAERGVRSVYLSDKDNVMTSGEAGDVLLWLSACAEPESESALRAALATASLDLSWQALDELNQDERRWEDKVEQFREYKRRWQRQGVLPMLRQLLRDFGVPSRLLNAVDGERSLTNLLHLSELLQQASAQLDGEQALVRWLAEERDSAAQSQASEEQIMRLESDADLVKVITIHKAKGLEYPLVFLPFICSFREVKNTDLPIRYHDDQGELQASLDPDAAILEQADRERLAEDMRLLYVAMTRPRHACWLGIAPVRSGRGNDRVDLQKSGIGHLLGWQAGTTAEALPQTLQALCQGEPGIAVVPAPEPDDQRYRGDDKTVDPSRLEVFQGMALERWWIASYSALQHKADDAPAPDTGRDENILEQADEATTAPPMPARDTTGRHEFVRGPMAGTFLHGLLELMADENFNGPFAEDGDFAGQLNKRLTVRRWQDWQPALLQWCNDMIATPLPLGETHLALSDLNAGAFRAELEFLLPAHRVAVEELDRLIREQVLPGHRRPALQAEQLNGMLKGFIDLVFEYQGRFYVMDYKSNWLGPDDQAYTEDAMREAVLHKRYDVQYSLYLLALHRLLTSRLGEAYDYDTHIGGAAYYFLRGLGADSRGLHFERPPSALMQALDALFAGETVDV
jgi:exodeoxyribonuclease V beta subunit